jgi:hypothetical protein
LGDGAALEDADAVALDAGADSSAMVDSAGAGSSFGALGAEGAPIGGDIAAGAGCAKTAMARRRAAGTMPTAIAAAARANASTHPAARRRFGAMPLTACMKSGERRISCVGIAFRSECSEGSVGCGFRGRVIGWVVVIMVDSDVPPFKGRGSGSSCRCR